MGKREDNKLAKELEKEIVNGIKGRLKGTGWKKKHGSFFRSINSNFYCASAYPFFEFRNSVPKMFLRARFESKPMGIDPIYWDIVQMPDNKKQPLSFRSWAAFKTDPAYFHLGTTICENIGTTDEVISVFVEWMQVETARVKELMENKPFSEIYESMNPDDSKPSFNGDTLVCALIYENREEEALALARKWAPDEFRNLCLNDNPNDRVNFFEMTILYLTGAEAFKKEVRVKPDPGFYKRKPRKFPWSRR